MPTYGLKSTELSRERDQLQLQRSQLVHEMDQSTEVRDDDPRKESILADRAVSRGKVIEIDEKIVEKNKAIIAAFEREDLEAQAAQARNVDTEGWTPELREFRDLAQRVTIVDYVDAVINNNGVVRGAAQEYNQHVFGSMGKPGDYPIEMLLDRNEKVSFDGHSMKLWTAENSEERTVITGPTGTLGAPSFVDRIMADGEAAFMGTAFPAVGPGPHSFPIVAGTTVAATIARGTAETAAGGITINDLTPERVQHSYEVDSGDELRLPGVMGYLQSDLRRSLRAGIDNKAIDAIVDGLTVTPAATTTAETLSGFMTRFAGVIDGRAARTINDLVCLLQTSGSNRNAYAEVLGASITNVGHAFTLLPHDRIRGSAHLSAGSGTDNGAVLFYGRAAGTSTYAPVWRRGNLLRDTGRLQLTGQVTLTGVAYTNVVRVHDNAYRLGSIHTS